MRLEPGNVIIVLHANGQVSFWERDTPEVLAYVDRVAALSTCDCPEDACAQEEMDRWRAQLAHGRVAPEQRTRRLPEMLIADLDPAVLIAWLADLML